MTKQQKYTGLWPVISTESAVYFLLLIEVLAGFKQS